MGKLSFKGAKTSNYQPKCNADKSLQNLQAELCQDPVANAEELKRFAELKNKAEEIMNAMKAAGNPHNVKYSAYKNKNDEMQYRITINGGGVVLKDADGNEVKDEKGNNKIVGSQTLDLILDKDMNVEKRFISKKDWDAASRTMTTTPLKKAEYNQAIKDMLEDLKDFLPAAPAREATPFVKGILEQLRELSPEMDVPEKVKNGKDASGKDIWVTAKDENGNDKMKRVKQYFATFDTYTGEKDKKEHTNIIISNHGNEQLTVALNDDQTGIRGVRYTDFSKFKETGNKDDIESIWLDDENVSSVKDNFLYNTVIGDILLKDGQEVSNDIEMDMNAPENIEEQIIDEDEIPFG